MDWNESGDSTSALRRFARSGALVRIVGAEDACEVCRSRARQIYAPADVPRLPIRGCQHGQCRCRFVAVDPESELTVPQLVERGVYALKAGRREVARQVLRRAVFLDQMYELGWLWLSAVVDEAEKVDCLNKVLEINPHNRRALAGLELLRKGIESAESPPAIEHSPARPAQDAAPSLTSIPDQVIEAREERRVIIDQWCDFTRFALQIDPQMVRIQGTAFLKKMRALGVQALDLLSPGERLEELRLQWQESEEIGEALADVIDLHRAQKHRSPQWAAMQAAMRNLAQQVLDHRQNLRAWLSSARGQVRDRRNA